MRKAALLTILICALAAVSCRQRSKEVAYYEHMIDSIRKAEQVKELQQRAGIYSQGAESFFDTLTLCPLPVQSSGNNYRRIGTFSAVPKFINEWFGYPATTQLRALRLPQAGRYNVILMAEMVDSITPALFLYTLDGRHRPVDQLCIYDEIEEDRSDGYGKSYIDYFITSRYEVTLLYYYKKRESETPELEDIRHYQISTDGSFEETFLEL